VAGPGVSSPPDVVGAQQPTSDPSRRIPSKRRRRRWLAAFVVLWTIVAAVSSFAWYEYGRLSSDLSVSNRRVGGPVRHALTPAPTDAAQQTMLVTGVDAGGRPAGGVVVLVRFDTRRHAVETLTVPSSAVAAGAVPLRAVLHLDGVAGAIGVVEHDLAMPVNHVLLVHLDQATPIVRSLGGITVTNPTPVRYAVAGARGVFPAGRLRLNGRTVQRYLDPTPNRLSAGDPATADVRQGAVVRGVTDDLVHIATPTAMTAVGTTISRNFATDLSPDVVLAIVAARLHAHTLVECRLHADDALTANQSTVVGFRTAAPVAGCGARPLTTNLATSGVAATILATLIVHSGSRVLYLLAVGSVAIWAIAAISWTLMLPSIRGVRRRRRRGGVRLRAPRRPEHGYRSRRRHRIIAVRVASVPLSIGLGMLIAHVLY
jgi:anionic cell wall polymer biosynthesis LytR-Cps2A-Psr (LCP) family protein